MWWFRKPPAIKPCAQSERVKKALAEHSASCVALESARNKELRSQDDWAALLRARREWERTALRFSPVQKGLFDVA